ncbi:MAG: class I SAM-dependent methyltransferase [candidate division Zixibacteria bacterium]|nr:class I SAM-dependent methyltransferase [candidate division Zixibacteria bacterium]
MTNDRPWHEQDEFWRDTQSLMFSEERLSKTPEEIDRVVSLLELHPGMLILDMCCGVGRHSLELARRGYKVTGVDRTRSYLDTARQAAEAEGLEIEFLLSDIREFSRPESFDVTINMFTSFGYFEDPLDDGKVVSNLYESLKPGGQLLIEMMGKEVLARIFCERDWFEMDDGTLILEERKVTRDWSWMENRRIALKGNQRQEYRFAHRPYSATELTGLLLECGFSTAQAYGGIDGSPYDHQAKRLAVVARR